MGISAVKKERGSKKAADVVATVPPGYKRTDVGVLPEDWAVGSLRSSLGSAPNYGVNAAAVTFDDNLPTYVRITDIDDDGRFRPSPRVSVRHPDADRFFLREGDLVFARTGASVGKSYRYDSSDGPLVFAGFLIRVTPLPDRLRPAFLAYYGQSKRYWDWVATASVRSGQPGINGQEYGKLQLPLPPPSEQVAIADALSDVDGLLRALEALIAKKWAIKQAAMQQLLTGKTRLPGFSGPWETVAPDDVATRTTGFWGSSEPSPEAPHRVMVIRAGDISPLGALTDSAVRYFSDAEVEKAACQAGDVVITVSGNGLGKTWLVDDQPHLAASNFVRILRTKSSRAHGPFLSAVLKSVDAQRLLTEHTATSAYPNLRSTFFSTPWLPLPQLDEQVAIATVLSDMDEELIALEYRRAKTSALKQGMMQQLLTGRVRLVEPEAAA